MTKKEREAIKEKYTAFNAELERIVAMQHGFTVPSEVRRDNKCCLIILMLVGAVVLC